MVYYTGEEVDLRSLDRPCNSMIRLVESIGILLGVPKTTEKSLYKAPVPSNYDETVARLSKDFYKELNYLTSLKSADIPNNVAAHFYNKTLEPAFDYEEAFSKGGLVARELYNIMMLTYFKLKADTSRPPVVEQVVTVIVDGTRSSYVAFDTACHVHNHGTLNIVVYALKKEEEQGGDAMQSSSKHHLHNDLVRRCKEHMKFQDHCYNMISIDQQEPSPLDARDTQIEELLEEIGNDILVLGMNNSDIGPSSYNAMAMWAAWEYEKDVIFCKGMSLTRPFTIVNFPRKLLFYVDSRKDIQAMFTKALKFVRPGDTAVVLSIMEERDPIGDSDKDTRFEFGSSIVWSSNGGNESTGPNVSDADHAKLEDELRALLVDSFLGGNPIIKRCKKDIIGEVISETAQEQSCSLILMPCSTSTEERGYVVDTIYSATMAVALIKG